MAVVEGTPPTINTPALVERVVPKFRAELGDDHVVPTPPVMGSEDFGLFSQGDVPIFMFRVGTVDPKRLKAARESHKPLPSLHSATYYPDAPDSIRTGIRAMTAAVVGLLPPKGK
jgi:hippurate hydrolase